MCLKQDLIGKQKQNQQQKPKFLVQPLTHMAIPPILMAEQHAKVQQATSRFPEEDVFRLGG